MRCEERGRVVAAVLEAGLDRDQRARLGERLDDVLGELDQRWDGCPGSTGCTCRSPSRSSVWFWRSTCTRSWLALYSSVSAISDVSSSFAMPCQNVISTGPRRVVERAGRAVGLVGERRLRSSSARSSRASCPSPIRSAGAGRVGRSRPAVGSVGDRGRCGARSCRVRRCRPAAPTCPIRTAAATAAPTSEQRRGTTGRVRRAIIPSPPRR